MELQDLLRMLDQAVEAKDDETRCAGVAEALRTVVGSGNRFLDSELLEPVEGHYGRRLIHNDPAGRYTVIAMIWGEGQGTPLHDHAGIWCVECVYQGEVRVQSYARRADVDSVKQVYNFELEGDVVTCVGEAGALIPPYEYHVIENAGSPTAATIHVYGGEMEVCRVFEPRTEGGWRRVEKELVFDA
jgi:predicted metal-dependent enzyme (double-stranded beta helix superfamily)